MAYDLRMAALMVGISPSEYLRAERVAERKHEWREGEVIEMPGVKKEHARLQVRLTMQVGSALRGTSCEFLPLDMRCRAGRVLYTYPDGMITCDARFEDEAVDVLLNPLVIFEVLSPSTEAYDRGAKFRRYEEIESLRDYVLIASETRSVEVFSRGEDMWVVRHATAGKIAVPSAGIAIDVDGLYDGVV